VIFHDKRASPRKLVLMKSRQQGTNIGAATDRLQSAASGFGAFASLQPLPHTLGRRGQRLVVGLFPAKFGNRLIKALVFFGSK
jgi:hypothetical protein